MSEDLAYLPADILRSLYLRRRLSPVDVVRALGDRIDLLNPSLNAITATRPRQTLTAARQSEARYMQGNPLALDGIPVIVKDLIDTAGMPTARGSQIFDSYVPPADAAVVSRIRAAGGIILAKAATHEFAWGVTTASSRYGPTRNPWSTAVIPGGSSGGSAAALAAGLAPLAVGTDTAGSIRIPASFCGVVGLKPTHSSIDMTGVFPLAPSLDHVGPMARTVSDARLLLSVLADPPARLAQSVRPAQPGPAGLRDRVVGLCPDLLQVSPSPAAQAAVAAAAQALRDLGVRIVEIEAPGLPALYRTLTPIVLAEGTRTHRDVGLWPACRAAYGADVRARLELGDAIDLTAYIAAQASRARVASAMRAVFTDVDVLLTPVTVVAPLPVGASDSDGSGMPFRELVVAPNVPQSLAGLPSCAIRAGFDESGIPVGVQLTAPAGHDLDALDVAEMMFRATSSVQGSWPSLP